MKIDFDMQVEKNHAYLQRHLGRRKLVCMNCGQYTMTAYNKPKSSRFGWPPCNNCGHKRFEFSIRSKAHDEIAKRHDAVTQRKKHNAQLSGRS